MAAFSGGGRAESDLKLEEVQVNTVEEACVAHEVRVTGKVTDLDGEERAVDFPAINHHTFTPDGVTRQCELLFDMYVRAVTYEQIRGYLSKRKRGGLTDDETATLQEVRDLLRESLQEANDD